MTPDGETGCAFCRMSQGRIVHHNELAYAIRDAYPVTPLHTLIIPRRHVPDYFCLSEVEAVACNRLLEEAKREIEKIDPRVSGFNIGINVGETAGQTVFHCHLHLIPRRKGDVKNPRGGVRHLIPRRGDYVRNKAGDVAG